MGLHIEVLGNCTFTLTILSTTSLKLSEADVAEACDVAWSHVVKGIGGKARREQSMKLEREDGST